MPTFNITVNVSDRVATLLGQAAVRAQSMEGGNLSDRDWFTAQVKELARNLALAEHQHQRREAPDTTRDAIPGEVS